MLFKYNSDFRQFSRRFVKHKFFEWTMLSIIIISTVQLAIDNPLDDPNSVMSLFLVYLDLALTGIFVIEAMMKIVAFGFVACGSTSYARSIWNQLDFFIVCVSVSNYLPIKGGYRSFR